MTKKKITASKKDCFLCYNLPLGEFTQGQIKRCAEHWMDAENCNNWIPVKGILYNKIKIKLL